ncbi:MAG: hypothetical protein Q7T80_00060 [Methanoregula sp.]|nr:hypothetical protein [Methanoregula sp.]
MTCKYLGQLKKWAQDAIATLNHKIATAYEWITSAPSAASEAKPILVAATDGNVLDMGKRYRLTSGHAPLFSLFTFFKNSQ